MSSGMPIGAGEALDVPPFLSGWRPDVPDIRDLKYSAPPEAVSGLPAKTNNRARFTSAIYNQGATNSCGPNSAASDIQWDGDQSGVALKPSRLFIYYATRFVQGTVQQDSGVSNRDMLKALARWGWCDESLWPFDPARITTQPSQEAINQAKGRLVDTYLRVPQQLDQMRACLAGGDPFILGFSVYESFISQEVTRTGNIPMPSPNERMLGGHDVLAVDYDDDYKVIKIRNSYGLNWGDKGWGTIPYSYATHPDLAADFWTIRWKRTTPPAPVPNPPGPTPTPTGTPYIETHVIRLPDGTRFITSGPTRPMPAESAHHLAGAPLLGPGPSVGGPMPTYPSYTEAQPALSRLIAAIRSSGSGYTFAQGALDVWTLQGFAQSLAIGAPPVAPLLGAPELTLDQIEHALTAQPGTGLVGAAIPSYVRLLLSLLSMAADKLPEPMKSLVKSAIAAILASSGQ